VVSTHAVNQLLLDRAMLVQASDSASSSKLTKATNGYPALFKETGLGDGLRWGLEIDGQSVKTTHSELTVYLPNGKYNYSIAAPAGYTVAKQNGTLTVHDVPTNVVSRLLKYQSVQGVLIDPFNNRMYIPNGSSNRMVILNATTKRYLGEVTLDGGSWGPLLGTNHRYIYVPDWGSNMVTVVNATTDVDVTNLSAGSLPYVSAIDPANGRLYVPDADASDMYVFNTSNYQTIGEVGTCVAPLSVIPVPELDQVYVTCAGDTQYTGNYEVFNATTDAMIAEQSFGDFSGYGGVYYAPSHTVFISNWNNHYLYAVDADHPLNYTRINLPNNTIPAFPTYDPRNGMIYFQSGFKVLIFDPATERFVQYVNIGTVDGALGDFFYDSRTGDLWVPEFYGPAGLVLVNGNPTTVEITFE